MAKFADRRRREVTLQVGQQVWLSTKHLPLKCASRKLAALWAGPYTVVQCVGDVAYKLELPTDWRIRDVFHVSQLKPVVSQVEVEGAIEVDGAQEFEVERILGHRVVRGTWEYLVKWKGYGDYENSWVRDMGNA